ncbi:MAG TPA: tetratricopeptide repeat protein [Dehalococcoidia bacterium]|nr:tetratricopeptide repeat protein [Dehalococcoidia bacterium]
MSDIFIAHVEEDAEISLEIALGLEEVGYTTWCYEVDSIPGPSYLIQTGQAVEEARALTLVISKDSLSSRQVTKEVIRAHETGKEFIPVLRDISHIEFQNRQPEWREALGAASSIRIPQEGVSDMIPRIVSGLKASGLLPNSKPDTAHIALIRKTLGDIQKYRISEKAGGPVVSAVGLEPETITEKSHLKRSAEEALWRKIWVRLTLAAFVIIAASVVGVLLINQSGPDSSESIGEIYELGLALLGNGQYEEAILKLNEVIDVDTDNAEAYFNRGLAYYYSGGYEQAILDFTEAIDLDPSNASAYNFRGDAYIALGEYNLSIVDFTMAISLYPDYQYAYHDRALAYYYKEEWNNAIADIDKAIEIDPEDASFYYLRGFFYREIGMNAEAIADFEKCIEISQDASLIQEAQDQLQELR